MSGSKKIRNLLLPLALVAIAAGFGLNASPPASAENATVIDENNKAQPEKRAVGSGDENVYAQEQIAQVPTGPNGGRQLFVQGCSSCHGVNGEGTEVAPPLIGVGAAAVDFYVSSGRMPAQGPVKQAPRRDPVYNEEQTAALAEYVATLGDGPEIPNVDPDRGDLVEGNLLYANNCAACHHATGSGGAVGRDYYAPNLYAATPVQVAEAIRVGPGAMPLFGHGSLNDQQVDSIVRYVEHLQDAKKPGGFTLGSLGPFSEGFIAWIVGLGSMLGIIRWIGTRD